MTPNDAFPTDDCGEVWIDDGLKPGSYRHVCHLPKGHEGRHESRRGFLEKSGEE